MGISKLPKSEWDNVADWWDSEVGDDGAWHQIHSIDPQMFELIGNIKGKQVLEIGCGNGYFARKLAIKGAKVIGVDISRKLLSYGIRKEKLRPLGVKYLQRDASNLNSLKSSSFDVVISNMAVMDIKDMDKTAKESSRVLRKGGRFIFSLTHPVFVERNWVLIGSGAKKQFAKAIESYLTPITKKHILWASGISASHYNRPISVYVKYLKDAGLLIEDLLEIRSDKKVKKATHADGDVSLRMTRYRSEKDKLLKKLVKKEIPEFLIISAKKI